MRPSLLALTCLAALAASTGCTDASSSPVAKAASASAVPVVAATAPRAATPAQPAPRSTGKLPTVLVHKSPSCGCCGGWVEHMRDAGFTVQVNETDALEPIKKRLGVPAGKGSCHTAEVGRYVVEGHVPAEDIKRLIARNDDSRGLVLPGMPLGSPGMEMPDGRVQPYTVERVDAKGATHPFASHGAAAAHPH